MPASCTAPGWAPLPLLRPPRNSHPASAADPAERALRALRWPQAFGHALPPVMRACAYMPYMHSEDLDDQRQGQARMKSLPEGRFFDANRKSAREHLAIVERFGRFPHRNAVLERESTPEELAFLETPGSSF